MRRFILGALFIAATSGWAGEGMFVTEGMFGYKWGAMPAFPQPSVGTCVNPGYPGTAWRCERIIGDVPVTVRFYWKHQLLHSVGIHADDGIKCRALWDTLNAAWGKPQPKLEGLDYWWYPQTWIIGDVGASWSYNQYTGQCSSVVVHMPSYATSRSLDEQSAAKGVKDL